MTEDSDMMSEKLQSLENQVEALNVIVICAISALVNNDRQTIDEIFSRLEMYKDVPSLAECLEARESAIEWEFRRDKPDIPPRS